MEDAAPGGGARWGRMVLFLVVVPLLWLGSAWLAAALDPKRLGARGAAFFERLQFGPSIRFGLFLLAQLGQVVAAVCLISYVVLLEVPGLVWALNGLLCFIVTVVTLDDHGRLGGKRRVPPSAPKTERE